jgi:hypothetical protein
MTYSNHYKYLDAHLPTFLYLLLNDDEHFGLVGAHGDKCYQYREYWKAKGIPFEHGCLIYLLSYLYPYSSEVRETRTYNNEDGSKLDTWVDPCKWVIQMYEELLPHILEAEREVSLYNERKKS